MPLFNQNKTEVAGQPRKRPTQRGEPVKIDYSSHPVTIATDFLRTDASHTAAITSKKVDFVAAGLPQYKDLCAIVIDNVLTAAECDTFLSLAEQSTIPESQRSLSAQEREEAGIKSWKPAMVNAGYGYEISAPGIRNSDRIIWDSWELMEMLWERVCATEGLLEEIGLIEGKPEVQGEIAATKGNRWKVKGLNERGRFLKYGPGQYFRPHCDGLFDDPITQDRSFYTLHLYLNGPQEGAENHAEEEILVGGATNFLSRDESISVDVSPRMGRVLIFQQKGLYHSGQEVLEGTKYTMRTDLMFERLPNLEK